MEELLADTSTYKVLKEKLDTVVLNNEDILVSFDVVSLFTNIPINTAKLAVSERWREIKSHTKLTKAEFFELFDICIKENNYFKFKDKYHQQLSGLAMGNPLSPILADIVLEKLFIKQLPIFPYKPTIIFKYVDDILLALPERYVNDSLTIFNSFHNNINFTIEKEVDGVLPYLDMKLIRNELKIDTIWHSKATSSNRLLNALSSHPFKMKRNVVISFIKRVFLLSSPKFRDENRKIITDILLKNNYQPKFIQKQITKVLYIFKKPTKITSHSENSKKIFGNIPYIPHLSEKIRKTITTANTENTYLIGNKMTNTLSHLYTNLKDKIPNNNIDGVVYKIPCECGQNYIGETSKTIQIRTNQHMADIRRTEKKIQNNENGFNDIGDDDEFRQKYSSALVKHSITKGHKFNFDNTEIIDREQNKQKRLFKESCHIWNNNAVNFKCDYNRLKSSYKFLIHKT